MHRILKLIRQNKKLLLLTLGIGLILILTPSHYTYAADPLTAMVNWLIDIAIGIASLPTNIGVLLSLLLVTLFFNIISSLLAAGFVLVVTLANWLIQSSINMMVIPGKAPDMVTAGWTFTLGFVNMLFILILAFYGLATILRIKDYDLRKTLPKILAIAILVNFTPVIVGLIVDAGNITTAFFMEKAGSIDIQDILYNEDTGIWKKIVEPNINKAISNIIANPLQHFTISLGNAIEAIGPLLVVIIFFIFAAIIYLFVAFVFLMRIVMLWILMILAPIAFFSYVIPEKAPITFLFPDILLWKKWWEEFIRWVIVGIPFGLFLYISNWIMSSDTTKLQFASTPDFEFYVFGVDIGAFFDAVVIVIPYTVGLAVLYVGYQVSMKAAPAGARGIIKGVTGAVKTVGAMAVTGGAAAVGATVGGAMAGTAAAGVSGVSSRLQSAEAWAGRRPGGRILKQAFKPFTGAARGAERVLVPRLRKAETEMKKVEVPKDFGNLKAKAQEDVAKSQLTAQGRLAYYAKMKPSDLSKSLEKDERLKGRVIRDVQKLAGDKDYEEEVKKVAKVLPEGVGEKVAIKFGIKEDDINEATKDLKKQLEDNEDLKIEIRATYGLEKDGDISEEIKRNIAAASVHASQFSSKDVSELSDTSLKSLPVRLGSKHWTGSHLAKVRDNFGKDTVQDFFEKPGGINTLSASELDGINPRLARSFTTTPSGQAWNWEGTEDMRMLEKIKKIERGNPALASLAKYKEEDRRLGKPEELKKIPPAKKREFMEKWKEVKKDAEKSWKRVVENPKLKKKWDELQELKRKVSAKEARAKKEMERLKRILTEEGEGPPGTKETPGERPPGTAESSGEETPEERPPGTAESPGEETPEERPPGTI